MDSFMIFLQTLSSQAKMQTDKIRVCFSILSVYEDDQYLD